MLRLLVFCLLGALVSAVNVATMDSVSFGPVESSKFPNLYVDQLLPATFNATIANASAEFFLVEFMAPWYTRLLHGLILRLTMFIGARIVVTSFVTWNG